MRKLKKGSVLVTGGAGFMGSSFIRTLLDLPDFEGKIINLDLLTYCGNLRNLDSVSQDPRYRFIQGDILDQKLVLKLIEDFQVDTIVHFAAESHVDRSIQSAKPFFKTNVLGTLNLLEAVKENKSIHFHHISTDEVYGEATLETPFTEDSKFCPNSPYAASKAASDHIVNAFSKTYRISTCITHSVNNFGPYQFPEKLVPLVISRLVEKKSIPIYGSGLQIRDWLFVEDHSRAVLKALEYGKANQIYNLSAKNPMTNLDLVHKVIDIFAELKGESSSPYKTLITHISDRLGHDKCYVVDPKKSFDELHWKPLVNFEEGLKRTVLWYLENLNWIQSILNRQHQKFNSLEFVGV